MNYEAACGGSLTEKVFLAVCITLAIIWCAERLVRWLTGHHD